MRSIINGLLYDTDTALELCDVSPTGYTRSDFNWEDTRLYRTKKGAFFLAGIGNARSRWATQFPNGSSAGSGIEVISVEKAKKLVETHGTVDLYKELFGPIEEG